MVEQHPDVSVYVAAVDETLEDGAILPGFGDAGDRLFGKNTKALLEASLEAEPVAATTPGGRKRKA